MSIKSLLTKITEYPVRHEVGKIVKHLQKNIDAAPVCCGKPMEFVGEHSGFRSNTQFYQCQICKKLELLHKQNWEK